MWIYLLPMCIAFAFTCKSYFSTGQMCQLYEYAVIYVLFLSNTNVFGFVAKCVHRLIYLFQRTTDKIYDFHTLGVNAVFFGPCFFPSLKTVVLPGKQLDQ